MFKRKTHVSLKKFKYKVVKNKSKEILLIEEIFKLKKIL